MAPRKKHRRAFGSLRKLPSGRYQARYPVDGEAAMRSLGTFATRREAEEALAVIQSQMVQGAWRDPRLGEVALGAYVGDLITSATHLRESTRALYARLHREWIDADLPAEGRGGNGRGVKLGGRSIGTLTPADVREWHGAVHREAERRALDRHARAATAPSRVNAAIRAWAAGNGRSVATTGRIPAHIRDAWEKAGGLDLITAPRETVNAGKTEPAQAYRLLRWALGHAVDDGLRADNPCKIPHAGQADELLRQERTPATVVDVQNIAAAMPARYSAAVWLAALSGLRAGELFGLQRRHVNLTTGELRVVQALVPGTAGAVGAPKTAAGKRVVHLQGPALASLVEHMATYTAAGKDAFIFSTASGRPLDSSNRSKVFRRAAQGAGRPDLTWHDLRHTAALYAAKSGATVAELQAHLGHSNARAAMRYQHAVKGSAARLAAGIADYVQGELTASA
ncbi:Lsr2 protein [Georgenia satyanarayanai]|uniref:Lsr2 protein n=1 Tax=Georgenia satyanarayanai TaxID=860221 RepID=A0A2Y9ANQ1_9MICO|nr:tyrosine-type recombinase/integrase [Georgenia satyanarayanai]PYF99065.1 Lsr2 protein [Georgenia satyanarayanai]SSA44027.1 Lsr2 protein [Georgenia satyanarayanai]